MTRILVIGVGLPTSIVARLHQLDCEVVPQAEVVADVPVGRAMPAISLAADPSVFLCSPRRNEAQWKSEARGRRS